MDSHQRRTLSREMQRKGLAPDSVPQGSSNPTSEDQPSHKKVAFSLIIGFVLALVAMGLPMVGITENLPLGAATLSAAFALLAYGIWQSEIAGKWGDAARTSVLWVLGISYFGLLIFQIHSEYQKNHHQEVRSGSGPTLPNSLVEADRLAAQYRASHPNQMTQDEVHQWVNEQLKKEGLPPQESYVQAPWGYVPNSPQCPAGVSHITNSGAVRGKVGFDIVGPCVVLDHDTTTDTETGYKVRPQ